MSSPGPLFVIGGGPLIGAHVARLFATRNFTHIALFSRTRSNLDQCSDFITTAAPSTKVLTYTADVTDATALRTALSTATADLGAPEVVLYNAARIAQSQLLSYPWQEIATDFAIPNQGLYTTAATLLPGLRALGEADNGGRHPALFVTSGAIVHQPLGFVFSLSMAKAAQASLVRCLAEEYRGVVHVAMVTVGGVVAVGDEKNDPEVIAERFWELWEQGRGEWAVEVRSGW